VLQKRLAGAAKDIVRRECGDALSESCIQEFFKATVDVAANKLWILPHYNNREFSVIKNSKGRRNKAANGIVGSTAWLMPVVDDNTRNRMQRLAVYRGACQNRCSFISYKERRFLADAASPHPSNEMKAKKEEWMKKVKRDLGLLRADTEVTSGTETTWDIHEYPLDPAIYGHNTTLRRAKRFLGQLDKIWAKEEAQLKAELKAAEAEASTYENDAMEGVDMDDGRDMSLSSDMDNSYAGESGDGDENEDGDTDDSMKSA